MNTRPTKHWLSGHIQVSWVTVMMAAVAAAMFVLNVIQLNRNEALVNDLHELHRDRMYAQFNRGELNGQFQLCLTYYRWTMLALDRVETMDLWCDELGAIEPMDWETFIERRAEVAAEMAEAVADE